MKLFLKKLLFFIAPLSVLFIFPTTVLILGKEYLSYDEVIKTQMSNKDALFGFAYNGASFYPYKEAMVNNNSPEVVALGTSRVMQIRREFFTATTTFINAGGAGKSFEDIEHFIQTLPSSTKVVLLGFDEEVFNGPYASIERKEEYVLPLRLTLLSVRFARRMYLDFAHGKFTLAELVARSKEEDHIGISALLHEDGFRADGSYNYGSFYARNNKQEHMVTQVKEMLKQQEGKEFLDLTEKVRSKNIASLQRTLSYAKEKGIVIIGFSTPVHPELLKNATMAKGATLMAQTLGPLFEAEQMPFFDMSTIVPYGGTSSEFVDALHATDKLHAKMLLYFRSRVSPLRTYVNQNLETKVRSTGKEYLSF